MTTLHIEGFRERIYWQAEPVLRLFFQNVDEKGVDSILSGGTGDPKRAQAWRKIISPYEPAWRKQQHAGTSARPIAGMSARAAEGLVQAAEAGLIDHPSWLALVRHWDGVAATAEQLTN